MKTIRDIAKLAGVSVTTVSKVINDYPDVSNATRKRVMQIMKEENFQPNPIAASLSGKSSRSVGIFLHCNPSWGLHHAFLHQILFSLKIRLGKQGYDCVIFPDVWVGDEKDFLQKCRTRRVDGTVLLGVDHKEPSLLPLLESDLPCVFIDSEIEGNNTVYVSWDHFGGSYQVAEYLYELGHRKIGLLQGLPESTPALERKMGLLASLHKHGLEVPPQWVVDGDFVEQSGYEGMFSLLQQNERPTAVVCQSDSMAIGALRAAKELGLDCPQDISIVGYDDIEVCRYITPRLTTVRQDTVRMGNTVADLLLRLLEGEELSGKQGTLPVSLMVRESCKRV